MVAIQQCDRSPSSVSFEVGEVGDPPPAAYFCRGARECFMATRSATTLAPRRTASFSTVSSQHHAHRLGEWLVHGCHVVIITRTPHLHPPSPRSSRSGARRATAAGLARSWALGCCCLRDLVGRLSLALRQYSRRAVLVLGDSSVLAGPSWLGSVRLALAFAGLPPFICSCALICAGNATRPLLCLCGAALLVCQRSSAGSRGHAVTLHCTLLRAAERRALEPQPGGIRADQAGALRWSPALPGHPEFQTSSGLRRGFHFWITF